MLHRCVAISLRFPLHPVYYCVLNAFILQHRLAPGAHSERAAQLEEAWHQRYITVLDFIEALTQQQVARPVR